MTDNSSGFLDSNAYNTLYLTILEAGTALSIKKEGKSKHFILVIEGFAAKMR